MDGWNATLSRSSRRFIKSRFSAIVLHMILPPGRSKSFAVTAYLLHTSSVMKGGSISKASNVWCSSAGTASGSLKSYRTKHGKLLHCSSRSNTLLLSRNLLSCKRTSERQPWCWVWTCGFDQAFCNGAQWHAWPLVIYSDPPCHSSQQQSSLWRSSFVDNMQDCAGVQCCRFL